MKPIFYLLLFSLYPLSAQEVIVNEATVTLALDGKPVFQYNKQPTPDAANSAPHFTRTGYIHPLYSPSGKVVTGDYSPDHRHQHGLFFAWTKSKFRGKKTEFWNQAKELGDIRFSKYLGVKENLSIGFEQIFTSGKNSDEPILRESWWISPPIKTNSCFQFDITSTQTCATDDPLVIEKYHYGGMAMRGNTQWMPPKKGEEPLGKMITSEGKTRADGNHSRPKWVAMYGPVDGEICGVAVLSHPDNFRFPQWVRLHPSMPYFVFSPMVEDPFKIAPENPYVSKFRYLTFDGEPDIEKISKSWQEFAKK